MSKSINIDRANNGICRVNFYFGLKEGESSLCNELELEDCSLPIDKLLHLRIGDGNDELTLTQEDVEMILPYLKKFIKVGKL